MTIKQQVDTVLSEHAHQMMLCGLCQANTAEADALEAEERAAQLEEELESTQLALKCLKEELKNKGDSSHAEREVGQSVHQSVA